MASQLDKLTCVLSQGTCFLTYSKEVINKDFHGISHHEKVYERLGGSICLLALYTQVWCWVFFVF